MRSITHLGEIGVAGQGILRPIDLTLYRNGIVWDLTGYTSPALEVWDYRTKIAVNINGTLALQTASAGIVRYTPGTDDPIYAAAGLYEARASAIPAGVGAREPSGVFRFSIGANAV